MTRGDRILLAMRRAGVNRTQLGAAVGVSQQAISYVLEREDGSAKTVEKIADILHVPVEWIRVGDSPPEWVGAPITKRVRTGQDGASGKRRAIAIGGIVSAGVGTRVPEWMGAGGEIAIPDHWVGVRVEGDSAYPAIYDGQIALVDESRAVDVGNMTDDDGWDLDEDLVLVRMRNDRALIKRFCFHPPNDFVLASVNGGRRSPLVRREDILHIIPVVATIWNDPSEDRIARRMAKRRAREGALPSGHRQRLTDAEADDTLREIEEMTRQMNAEADAAERKHRETQRESDPTYGRHVKT